MMERLINLPTYSSITTVIDAAQFNAIRRAMLKSKHTIRIPLTEFKDVDLLIDHDSWTCVDSNNQDMPLVAWIHFAAQQRESLHSPIRCTKNYYHFGAAKIARDALRLAVAYFEQSYSPAPACRLPPAHARTWKTNTQAVLTCV